MRRILLTAACSAVLSAASAETFTGVITDTMCGARHTMMKNEPDGKCIKMCTEGQYAYALFDGTTVMKLSDQKRPAQYRARKVKVVGTYNQKTKTIKVSSIEPVNEQ